MSRFDQNYMANQKKPDVASRHGVHHPTSHFLIWRQRYRRKSM